MCPTVAENPAWVLGSSQDCVRIDEGQSATVEFVCRIPEHIRFAAASTAAGITGR
jgi:hypothetical protein